MNNVAKLEGLKVADLRNILVGEFGMEPQEAQSIKGKKALIQAIKDEHENIISIDEGLLDELEIQSDISSLSTESNQSDQSEPIEVFDAEILVPTPSCPEWTEYVLQELTSDEKIKDKNNPTKEYPTTDGLRRLVEKFVGPIVKSNTLVVQTPSPENERRATVVVHISVLPNHINYNDLLEYSGASDVYVNNSVEPFSKHPVATSETKSAGRAYKRALKIKVSTYEEMDLALGSPTESMFSAPMNTDDRFIKPDQINFIDTLCGRLDINVQKFIRDCMPDFNSSLNKLPYEESCGLLSTLQKYQGEGKNTEVVKEEIKGYDANWQNTWYKSDMVKLDHLLECSNKTKGEKV